MSHCHDSSSSTIIAEMRVSADPCPMTHQTTHIVNIIQLARRQIYGNLTCSTRSKTCRFIDPQSGRQIDRRTLMNIPSGSYNLPLARNSTINKREEVKTIFKYRDSTEKPPKLAHTEKCRYIIDLL
jgi:hypothetical protein